MIRPLLPAASLLLAGLLASAPALAWDRAGTINTSRGTATTSGSGGCAGGTCSRSSSITGAGGKSASRSGSVSASGNGSVTYGHTSTGPAGNSINRSGSVSLSR